MTPEERFAVAAQQLDNALQTLTAARTEFAAALAELRTEQDEVSRAVKQVIERVRPTP